MEGTCTYCYTANWCQGWSSEYGHEAEEGEEAWIAVGVDDTERFKYLEVWSGKGVLIHGWWEGVLIWRSLENCRHS
jgi:hypothetical protein